MTNWIIVILSVIIGLLLMIWWDSFLRKMNKQFREQDREWDKYLEKLGEFMRARKQSEKTTK